MITYFENFSKQQFFEDENHNGAINQIYFFLINMLGEDYVVQNLVFDKNVALSLQVEYPVTISTIDMFTNKIDVFNTLKTSLKFMNFERYKFENETIELKTLDTIIYIRFRDIEVDTLEEGGIYYLDIKHLNQWQ